MINMKLLEIKDLNKSFDNKEILKDINLSIQSGKIIGLLGKNGVGKTTLIKLINDLLTPTSGQILIKGQKIGVETKKVISYLPERTYLNKQMKVSEVISYFEDFYDNFDSKKAKKLLKDLDLDINQKLTQMSKGMQEKVQLVLVMSRNADLYVLDEPLGGVDPATRDYILDPWVSWWTLPRKSPESPRSWRVPRSSFPLWKPSSPMRSSFPARPRRLSMPSVKKPQSIAT